MRFLNRLIPEEHTNKCDLETLRKVRNMLTFPPDVARRSWFITMDLASGYHNFWIHKKQWPLMGIAIHVTELPAEAIEWLRRHFPKTEDKRTETFYFIMRALPFGLSSSCAVFSDVVTALAAAWRRHEICARPLRVTSYIDDYLSVSPSARAALVAAVELVYEATAAGLTINVQKCRLGPATKVPADQC